LRFARIASRTSASQTNSTAVGGGAAGATVAGADGVDAHCCDSQLNPPFPRAAKNLSTTLAATLLTTDEAGGEGEHPQDPVAVELPPDAATAMPREAR
jgi:hypothetical protein